MCTALAQGCALERHGAGDASHPGRLHRAARAVVAVLPRLPARSSSSGSSSSRSITSEVGVWGDTRSSICAVRRATSGRFKLDKDATTASYAEHADDLLVTCRRDADAPPSDQVLVLVRKGDCTLDADDDLGHDGHARHVQPGLQADVARAPRSRCCPGSFADASAQTMVSYSHILWSARVARHRQRRRRARVRLRARRGAQDARRRAAQGDAPRRGRRRSCSAAQQRARRQAAEFDEIMTRPTGMEELLTVGWALKMNNIKVASSEMAPAIVHDALQIIGIAAYKNDSKLSVGRQYRDSLSAALMISNDRIFGKTASLLLVLQGRVNERQTELRHRELLRRARRARSHRARARARARSAAAPCSRTCSSASTRW